MCYPPSYPAASYFGAPLGLWSNTNLMDFCSGTWASDTTHVGVRLEWKSFFFEQRSVEHSIQQMNQQPQHSPYNFHYQNPQNSVTHTCRLLPALLSWCKQIYRLTFDGQASRNFCCPSELSWNAVMHHADCSTLVTASQIYLHSHFVAENVQVHLFSGLDIGVTRVQQRIPLAVYPCSKIRHRPATNFISVQIRCATKVLFHKVITWWWWILVSLYMADFAQYSYKHGVPWKCPRVFVCVAHNSFSCAWEQVYRESWHFPVTFAISDWRPKLGDIQDLLDPFHVSEAEHCWYWEWTRTIIGAELLGVRSKGLGWTPYKTVIWLWRYSFAQTGILNNTIYAIPCRKLLVSFLLVL